ncbi:MAG: CdaR family transcriptional regulator [Bacillota bacterium]|jgi:carbohydrate diacid regulator
MLNKRNCQSIAETASNIIGYSILLTGHDGIILGSSDPDRVGTLHEASLEVIRSGCQVFHDEQQAKAYQGTRPGTTIPIIINDEVVGSIGITGKPEEISKYGILIKKLAEVFLKDQMEMESAQLLDQSRQNLLRELITCEPNSMEEKVVMNHGQMLGYDLFLPRAAVLIEVAHSDEPHALKQDSYDFSLGSFNNGLFQVGNYSIVKQAFNHKQDLCVSLGYNKYIVFSYLGAKYKHHDDSEWITLLNARCNNLLSQFDKAGLSAWVGIGSRAAGSLQELRDSYDDANQAIFIAKRRMKSGVQYINDVYLEKLILSIPDHMSKRIFKETVEPLTRLKDGDDFINMVISWCENRFNFTQTAKSLNIHKNTLMYRFSKFKAITGLDLYDFNSTIAMYIVITNYKVNNLL